MGKPLLTDDIIERARRGEKIEDNSRFGHYKPEETYGRFSDADLQAAWDEEEYQGYREGETVRIPVDASIIKSRRIETVKRDNFRSKVNKILFWVIVLVVLLLLAVFYL